MVITDKIVWAHLAKTGGTSLGVMFEMMNIPGIEIDQPSSPDFFWIRNEPRWLREEKTGRDLTTGRALLMNLRRLPSFMLSMAFFKQKENGFEVVPEELSRGLFRHERRDMQTGALADPDVYDTHSADDMLQYYRWEEVDHWIRMEHLVEDFVEVITPYHPVDPGLEQPFRELRLNVTEYDRNLSTWFSRTDLDRMYHACPLWAALEQRLYGGLL